MSTALSTALAVLLVLALRIAWLIWSIRFKRPLDIINADLARQRARRRRVNR